MNNIYVDELPKSCAECKFCEYYEEDVHGKGMHEVACCLNGFLTNALWGDQLEVKYCPHLKLITDLLAEERKKVVQEIRDLAGDYFEMPYCDACGNTDFNDVVLTGKDLTEILDDVESGD